MFHRFFLTIILFAKFTRDVNSGRIPKAMEDDMERNPETIEELVTNDYAIMEGDMILPTNRNAVGRMWSSQEIPYNISPDLESRTDDIHSAMAMVSEHTCISFHKRTTENNYLLFKSSKGCSSFVGVIGGQQPLFVGPRCTVGNIVHEILHALGFHHEHTRTDREQYIIILHHNIIEGMKKNFKIQEGETFDFSYDVSSIMHYGGSYFSANGQPTIIPRNDTENMGQRVMMTKTDIEKVRRLYHCDATDEKPREESSDLIKEEDSPAYRLVHDVESTLKALSEGDASVKKPQEHNTTAPVRPPPLMHHLNASTRGQNSTSGGMD